MNVPGPCAVRWLCPTITNVKEALVLGADCGGTASRVVVATVDGRIVGRGRGGAGNPVVRDARDAATELTSAARQALAGQDPRRLVRGVVGMAGDSRLTDPQIAAAYAREWAAIGVRCPVRTVGDAVVAFASGTPDAGGAVLIAGTGAVAATITGWAVHRTADGLGWLLGDEGSGFWLGLSAARRTARALYAGRAGTPLVRAVCERVGSTAPDTFVARIYQLPREHLATLASAVIDSARAGDSEAAELLDAAADRLVDTLVSLTPDAGPIVLAGGVLLTVDEVRDAVQDGLLHRLGRPGITGGDGAVGAAWLAVREVSDGDGARARDLHPRMLAA
jgi:N-acetylglucosamine kinase-like BadF-type ATPase